MIKKEFIDYLGEKSQLTEKSLIEKDFLLQSIIKKLTEEVFFQQNFLFKGGTCLIKCYLGYYRFSEDLDFTWRNQQLWEHKTGKEIRKEISQVINDLSALICEVSSSLRLQFQPDKNDRRYMEFGAGNIFTTFKLWYHSAISNQDEFIKIQINFVEVMKYNSQKRLVNCLVEGVNQKEVRFLFPEYANAISDKLEIEAYDLREILIEKIRAILTRRTPKARDFFDVFLISQHLGENLEKYEKDILDKVLFMLKYEKYLNNLLHFTPEDNILIKPLGEEFDTFMGEFYPFLQQLLEKIKHETR